MATVKELKAKAKKAGVSGYSSMTKPKLLAALGMPAEKKAKAKKKKAKRITIKMKDLLELVIIADTGERLMLQQAPPRFIGMYQLYPERK